MLFLPLLNIMEKKHHAQGKSEAVWMCKEELQHLTAPPRSGNASPQHAAGAWASTTPARTTKDPQGSTARCPGLPPLLPLLITLASCVILFGSN